MAKRQTLTIKEAAEELGISLNSAYRAAREGEIPAIRIGGKWLVPRDRLEALLRGEEQAA